jgi:hypothetical protein
MSSFSAITLSLPKNLELQTVSRKHFGTKSCSLNVDEIDTCFAKTE